MGGYHLGDVKEIEDGCQMISMVQKRAHVNTIMNLLVPDNSAHFLAS